MSTLRDKLIRLGNRRKDLQNDLSPVIQHLDARDKKASTNWYEDGRRMGRTSSRGVTAYDDPAALDRALSQMDDKEIITRHALLMGEPLSEKDVLDSFRNMWGLEPKAKGGRGGLPRHKGDRVRFEASSCKIDPAVPLAQEHDGKEGTIVETEKEDPGLNEDNAKYGDVMIQVDSGPIIRYPQGQRKSSIGLKAPQRDLEHSVEVVYIAGNRPTPEQIEVAQDYLDKAKGDELRSTNYYSGWTGKPAYHKKKGHLYFRVFNTQQRNWRDATTISLGVGQLLHIGDPRRRQNVDSKRDDLRKFREQAS